MSPEKHTEGCSIGPGVDIWQEYGQEAWNVLYFLFLVNCGLFADDPSSQGQGTSNRETSREQTRFWPQVKHGDDILSTYVPRIILLSIWITAFSPWVPPCDFSHDYLKHSFLPFFHFLYFIPSTFLVFSFWRHIPSSYVFRKRLWKVFFHPLQIFMYTSSCLIFGCTVFWLNKFPFRIFEALL